MKNKFIPLIAVCALMLGALAFAGSVSTKSPPGARTETFSTNHSADTGIMVNSPTAQVAAVNTARIYSNSIEIGGIRTESALRQTTDSKVLTGNKGEITRISQYAKYPDETTKANLTYKSPITPRIFKGIGVENFARAKV